jgi:hypothetical protein
VGGGRARLTSELLLPIGAFGLAVTLGLYLYEMRGIQYCSHLIATGAALEERLGVKGRFRSQPPSPGGFVNEIWAAHIIYAAVLAGWTFVMSILPYPGSRQPAVELASALAVTVFLVVMLVASQVPLLPRARADPTARHGVNAGDMSKRASTTEPR